MGTKMARSLARSKPPAHNWLIAGSNPAAPTIYVKSTLMMRVIELKLKGIPSKIICERLGIKPNTVRVYWWRYNHPVKEKQIRREYYLKNKKRIDKSTADWIARNPELHKEYQYRTKCNKAGVDWRMAG